MSRNLAILSVLVLTFPIAVDVPSDSAGTPGLATRISLAAGGGTYALIARDCEGGVRGQSAMDYREFGGQVDQQVSGRLNVGIRGGVVREHVNDSQTPPATRTSSYANPYIAFEGRRAGIGAGGVFGLPQNLDQQGPEPAPVSAHLRLGGRTLYLSAEVMEGVPLYSGGGYGDVGVGFRPARVMDCWIGVNIGPFDAGGIAVKTAWQVHPRWTLDVNGRLGNSEHVAENGVGVGITSSFGHP